LTTSLDAPHARRPTPAGPVSPAASPSAAGARPSAAAARVGTAAGAAASNPSAAASNPSAVPTAKSIVPAASSVPRPPDPRGPAPRAADPRPADPRPADPRLDLVRALGDADDFETAAAELCTRLATGLGAARVVLGWRARGRPPARAVALSGAGEPEWDGEIGRLLGAAMDEAIDQARALVCPPPSGQRGVVRALDAQRRAGGAQAVAVVPLARRGEVHGAVLAEFERPIGAPELDRLREAAALAAPWLRLQHARRSGPLHRGLVALGLAGAPAARRPWRRRALALSLAAAALAAFALPIDLTVGAPARVEGELQRIVPAPIRGYLKAVHVRPGDTVREGDLLAELGDRDLELERAKLKSELAQHEGNVAAAMARGERGPMAVAQARVDEARARIALVDHQLERIRVRSPIDGVVLQGDLWQQVGTPLDRGRELFVLAPARRHRVVIELDERDLRRVPEGARGRLALSALPWETMPMSVERIAPAATTIEGRNVFELEARLDAGTEPLRAGQRGVAHLDAGRGPVGVEWARRAGDALARLVWRWMP
jgi:multidrug efflux pump subunit AcrA (membrane-fusion protein)